MVDKDRIVGSAKVVKGNVKEAVGKAVGDAKLEAKGKAEKIEGKVQNAVGGHSKGNRVAGARCEVAPRGLFRVEKHHDDERNRPYAEYSRPFRDAAWGSIEAL
jgi:uncharacterized protein YjbJ (UPF0337 family)